MNTPGCDPVLVVTNYKFGAMLPGLIAVHQRLPIGSVVDDLVLVVSCSFPADWVNQVRFLPLR